MGNEFIIINIRRYLQQGEEGEKLLKQVFSTFSCKKNADVDRFLLQQSIDFTKKNQSVTYIVVSSEHNQIVGYFTITIKPITVNVDRFSNTTKRKIARVSEQNIENGNYSLSAYLIAQIGKNYRDGINDKITGEQLLELAINKIKELQYMAGGMVIFLESENNDKLLHFYECENGFKRFDVKEVKSGTEKEHTLIQLLNYTIAQTGSFIQLGNEEMMGHFYFVRHGQTVWNVENKICGATDIELTELGHQQARDTGKKIVEEGIKADEILYSPLIRAAETARHISEITGIPARMEPRLIEQNFGKWESTPRDGADFKKAKEFFACSHEGGESTLRLAQRIYNLLDDIKAESDSKTYILVAHNGIARVVQSYFTDMTNEEYAAYGVKNCEVVRYDFK